tara:strand:- start:506 stop:721 length:216 start_codon:yes stop_codon:yes gene_type:complete
MVGLVGLGQRVQSGEAKVEGGAVPMPMALVALVALVAKAAEAGAAEAQHSTVLLAALAALAVLAGSVFGSG